MRSIFSFFKYFLAIFFISALPARPSPLRVRSQPFLVAADNGENSSRVMNKGVLNKRWRVVPRRAAGGRIDRSVGGGRRAGRAGVVLFRGACHSRGCGRLDTAGVEVAMTTAPRHPPPPATHDPRCSLMYSARSPAARRRPA